MGMYTEIFVNVDLKEDTPQEVISILGAMCFGRVIGAPTVIPEDSFEHCPDRWALLFNDGSHYTPRTSCAELRFCETAKAWSLLGKGDIKNYNHEIEEFFEWIMPYVEGNEGDFIGYYRHENCQLPTLVLLR